MGDVIIYCVFGLAALYLLLAVRYVLLISIAVSVLLLLIKAL